MADKCTRCGKSVYANDNPQRVNSAVFHFNCFKCKFDGCGSKLTLATCNSRDGEVYCKNHVPKDAPNQTIDITMQNAMNVPDSTMNQREFGRGAGGSAYGAGAIGVASATTAPKASGVAGVNKMEVLHQSKN